MTRKKLAFLLIFMSVILIAGLLVLPRNSTASLALSKFNQIDPGMTRKQVWQLMEDIPEADSSPGNSLDTWQFRDRFVIIVKFEPDYSVQPGTVDERDPEGENWKVTVVNLLDFSKPNPIQQLLKRFGLWSNSPHRTKLKGKQNKRKPPVNQRPLRLPSVPRLARLEVERYFMDAWSFSARCRVFLEGL